MTESRLQVVIEARNEATKAFLQLKSELSSVKSSFSTELGLIKKTGEMAAVGLTALTGAILAAGAFSIKSAGQVETLKTALKTAMGGNGSEAEKAFKTISQFAKKTPYELEEVMRGFIKLKNMGLNPSERALTAYGDTASAMGKSLNDMVEAVADAATGEFERLKEFGIRASQQGDKVSFTFKGVTTTVKKNAKEIEGYIIGLGEKNFAGGMDEQSKTLIGSLSSLSDAFSLTMASIATDSGILQIVKDAVSQLTNFIEQNQEAIVAFVREGVTIMIDKIREWIKEVGGPAGIKQKFIEFKDILLNEIIPSVVKLVGQISEITKYIYEHRQSILLIIVAYETLKVAMALSSLFKTVISVVGTLTSTMIASAGAVSGLGTALTSVATVALPLLVVAFTAFSIYGAIKQFKELQNTLVQNSLISASLTNRIYEYKKEIGTLRTDKANEQLRNSVNEMEKMKKELDEINDRYSGMKGVLNAVGDQFTSWAKKASSAISSVLEKAKKIPSGFSEGSSGGGSGGGGGGSWRATGGSVMSGREYIVGENGPEVFTPSVGGKISQTSQSSEKVVQNFNFNFSGAVVGDKYALIREIKDSLNRDQELIRLGIR